MFNLKNTVEVIIKYSFYFTFLFIALISIFDGINRKLFIWIGFILIGIIAVFRYNIGSDYVTYSYIYEWVNSTSLTTILMSIPGIEIGFRLLIGLFKALGLSFQVFIGALSIFMISLVAHYTYQNSRNQSMSLLVYYSMFFVVWNLSGLRQGLALTLSLYLLYNPKYEFKDWVKVIIILLLASLHYSSLILLVFLILEKINWNQKRLGIYLIVCLLFSMVPIHGIFVYLSQTTFVGTLPLYQKAMIYINGMTPTYGFIDVFSMMRVFFAVLVLVHYPRLIIKNTHSQRIFDTLILGMGIFLILSFNDLIAARLSIYALILLVPILPMIVELYENQRIKHVLVVGAFIVLNFFFLFKDLVAMKQQLGIQDGNLITEYHHIFEIID